jgi:hypothetical protein
MGQDLQETLYGWNEAAGRTQQQKIPMQKLVIWPDLLYPLNWPLNSAQWARCPAITQVLTRRPQKMRQ